MSPQIKKFLSAIAVAAVGAVLVTLNQYTVKLPPELQGLAVTAIAAVAHYANAWGHAERVEQVVTQRVAAVIAAESSPEPVE